MESFLSEDSMNDSIEQENRHSLHAINQQLLFNGYQSIFNEENSQIDEEKLKQILGKVLRNENDLQKRVTESLDEHRKTQADLKRALVKGESLQQEIHQLERHLAECKARELRKISRIDELELKLRKKTEEARKLTIIAKNTESKFNIDKRKLEMTNSKFKDKVSDLTKGSTSKERQKRFDAIINLKRGLVEKSVGQNRATLSIALQESENHVRQLVEENAALNEIMKNSKEQIYETLSSFPNFEVKNEIPESSLDSRKVEIEIAQNCQAVIKMIKDLDKHNQRQINEMERDLEARQQKELVTTVANFEVKLEEAKARQEEIENQPISEEEIFQKMVKMVEEEDEIAQDEISNEDLIQNYLRDCSNQKQTPPRGQNTSDFVERTPDSIKDIFDNEENLTSNSTPLHKQMIGLKMKKIQMNSPGGITPPRRSLARPEHLFSPQGFDDDSLEIQ